MWASVFKIDLSENKFRNCRVQHEDSIDLNEILPTLMQKFKAASIPVSEKLQIFTIIPLKKLCKFLT